MISREQTDLSKQESSTSDNTKASSSSTTTSWTRLKDPRIVRVSRAFGGKDRHSKVCTVRGLRDRRVRLSVPTAIQLYDLQDRLGLSQPSKVVDWLLNAAKNEINELPPLQIPQGAFTHNLDPINHASLDFAEKSKHVISRETSHEEERQRRRQQQQQLRLENTTSTHNNNNNNNQGVFASSNNFPFKQNLSSSFPYNSSSFVRWDPSNLTLSHPPRSHGFITNQQEVLDWHNMNFPSSSESHHNHHQVLVCHQTQPYFPSQIGLANTEFDPKQMNFQTPSSSLSPHVDSNSTSTQSMRPIDFNMTVNLLPSQNNEGR